jgi:predicted nucleic acid-binding protein
MRSAPGKIWASLELLPPRKETLFRPQVARIISPRTALQVVAADPDDDRILECGREGKADLVVTNDHHLLDLKSYENITQPRISAVSWP